MTSFQPNPQPVVSVIVAAYNVADILQGCIDSVTAQTWKGWELLITDDGSSDGTADLIAANGEAVAWTVSKPNGGIGSAWNAAIPNATGDWLYFMGADDRFRDERVLADMAPALARAQSPVVYGRVDMVDSQGAILRVEGQPWELAGPLFLQVNSLPHQGVFHHRSLFERHGLYDTRYRIVSDYEFLLRELKDGGGAEFVNRIVSAMQEGGVSSRVDGVVSMLGEFREAQRRHGLPTEGPFWRRKMREARVHQGLNRLLGPDGALRVVNAWRRLRGRPPKITHR